MNVFRFECDIAGASAKFVRLLLMTVAFVFDLSMKSYAYDSEDELIVDEYEYFVAEDVGYEEDYENLEFLRDFIKTPSNSKEKIATLEQGAYEASSIVEGIPALDLYQSVYDNEIKSINELRNLEDFRAEKQPGLLKMFNGMVKGTYYVYSLFCYTLVIQTDDFQLNDKLEKQIPNYMTSEERLENEKEEWSEMIDNANFWGCVLGGYQQRGIKSFGEFLIFLFCKCGC